MEEKLSKVAQLLSEQMQQHCFIKLDRETTQPLPVAFVKDYGLSEESLLDCQGEVARLIEESGQIFLSAASEAIALEPPEEAACL